MDPLQTILDALESMARQHCCTRRVDSDYNGQVAGSLVTDSGALSTNAEALELLAEHGRFHVIRCGGRMVVGYWPENLPDSLNTIEKLKRHTCGELSCDECNDQRAEAAKRIAELERENARLRGGAATHRGDGYWPDGEPDSMRCGGHVDGCPSA